MQLMLTQVHNGRLTLEDYVRMAAGAPARAFGLFPRKGAIAVGADADIAFVDMERRHVIRAAELHSRGKITPFEGMETVGLPVHTMVRGRFVMKDRSLVVDTRGWGSSVRRVQRMPEPQPRNTDQTMDAVTQAVPQRRPRAAA